MTLPDDTILENRYRIDSLLAHGGMGAIYRGFDTNLSTPVAIKENFFQTPQHVAQFKQEALILARLRHPALPRVSHHFSFEGQQYLVMDFIEGDNLWEIVEQRGEPLGEKEALDYIIQVCHAVGYLHRQTPPIIHRDIKPQNIKITPEGKAMLVDFGIAKQVVDDASRTESGAQRVTSGFSPPEQYSGSGTSPVSDIYSLGATLYAVLTGQKPPDSVGLLVSKGQFKAPNLINTKLSSNVSESIVYAMQPKAPNRPQSIIIWQRGLEEIAGATVLADQDKETTMISVTNPQLDAAETLHAASAKETIAATHWLVDSTGTGYPLGAEALIIGRHSDSDVVIDDPNISRNHAKVRIAEEQCVVKDENSANGTFLNGFRLRLEWYPLNQGDVLTIGPARFYLTTTRPVKLASPKAISMAEPRSVDVATPEKAPAQPATDLAPVAQPAKSRRGIAWVVLILVVIIALAGLGGYLWLNPDLLSTTPSLVLEQDDTRPEAPMLVQTQTAEAIAIEAAEAEAQSTRQVAATRQAEATLEAEAMLQAGATSQAEETRQAEKTQQAKEDEATAQARSSQADTLPSKATTRSDNTLTPTPAPTDTLTPAATEKSTPVVTGPTLIPLNSVEALDRIGSQEVTDVDINPKNPKEVFALVKKDGIYKSSNGGDGPWARVNLDGSAITSVTIDAADPTRIYASTWNAVLKSTDGGNTWEPKTNGLLSNQAVDLVTIHPANPDILYAGVGETFVVSTDQGESWTSQLYGAGLGLGRLYAIVVDPFDTDTIYVGGLASSIYKSEDSGQTFIQLPSNVGAGAFGLAAHPTQPNVYLAGINSSDGGIIKTDNGFEFRLVNDGLIYGGADSAYSAITYVASNPNIVYSGSGYESNDNAKGIFKSINGGESWNKISNGLAVNPGTGHPFYVKAIVINPTNPNTVFAATGSGLYKSVDGGSSWSLR